MSKSASMDSSSIYQAGKARIRCIIEITQPDGTVFQVETEAADLIPELESIDLTTRKGFMQFISMADQGIVAVRNEAGRKALEEYAREALKKTNLTDSQNGK